MKIFIISFSSVLISTSLAVSQLQNPTILRSSAYFTFFKISFAFNKQPRTTENKTERYNYSNKMYQLSSSFFYAPLASWKTVSSATLRASCTYWYCPPFLNCATACPFPWSIHFVVNKPSTPTGPRAWILPVLIPTSAPANLLFFTWRRHFGYSKVQDCGKQNTTVWIFQVLKELGEVTFSRFQVNQVCIKASLGQQ